jgi:pantoate kinase
VIRAGAGIDGEIHRYQDISGPICAVSFGPIHTPSVIGSAAQMARVDAAYPATVPGNRGRVFPASRDRLPKRAGWSPRRLCASLRPVVPRASCVA